MQVGEDELGERAAAESAAIWSGRYAVEHGILKVCRSELWRVPHGGELEWRVVGLGAEHAQLRRAPLVEPQAAGEDVDGAQGRVGRQDERARQWWKHVVGELVPRLQAQPLQVDQRSEVRNTQESVGRKVERSESGEVTPNEVDGAIWIGQRQAVLRQRQNGDGFGLRRTRCQTSRTGTASSHQPLSLSHDTPEVADGVALVQNDALLREDLCAFHNLTSGYDYA